MSEIKKERVFSWILLGAVILMYAAFYNGFPMVTSDSGAYIGSGFKGWVPIDRPIFYGLFIRHSSLASSLWFTVFFQALMLSFVLWQTINKYTADFYSKASKFALLIILTCFSSVSWFVGQIMPDIFVGIGLLAFLLIILSQKNAAVTTINTLILLVSCLVHNSSMLIFSILTILTFLYALYSKAFTKKIVYKGRYVLAVFTILSAWIITPLLNFHYGQKFEISGSPHVFLMAKNIENGIVDRYLKENCDKYLVKKLNDSTEYFLFAKHSKKAVDISRLSKDVGGSVQQWSFTGATNQKYKIVKGEKGWFRLLSVHSNLYFEAKYDSVLNRNNIFQASKRLTDEQLFKFISTNSDSNSFYIINKNNNKYLEIFQSNQENGVQLNLGDSAGSDNQKFQFMVGNNCMCLYKDMLPNSAITFIWSDNGPFSKTGSWAWSAEEYNIILERIFFSTEYFGANVGEAMLATFSQLTRNDIGDGLIGYDNKSAPYISIETHFPYELKQFSNSTQNRWQLNFVEINKRHFWLLIISLIIVFVFLSKRELREKIDTTFLFFLKICLTAILFNAFVTGALANVLDRLEARIIWVLPLVALILVFNFYSNYKKKNP